MAKPVFPGLMKNPFTDAAHVQHHSMHVCRFNSDVLTWIHTIKRNTTPYPGKSRTSLMFAEKIFYEISQVRLRKSGFCRPNKRHTCISVKLWIFTPDEEKIPAEEIPQWIAFFWRCTCANTCTHKILQPATESGTLGQTKQHLKGEKMLWTDRLLGLPDGQTAWPD